MKAFTREYLLPDEEVSWPGAGRLANSAPGDSPDDRRRPWARGCRELVLLHLDKLGTATVGELAASVGLRPAVIGPRLTELHALGQVRCWRVKPRGRGQPRKVWTRTP